MEAICGEIPFRGKKIMPGGSLVKDLIQHVQVLVWLFWFIQCEH